MRIRLVVDDKKTIALVVTKHCKLCSWSVRIRASSPKAATRKAIRAQAARSLKAHLGAQHGAAWRR